MQRNNIPPKAIFSVYKSASVSDMQKEALLYLYQPIISADTVALYLNLLHFSGSRQDELLLHGDLFKFLNIGGLQFIKMREKLEGIGLLDVYEKYSNDFGKVYLYDLHAPKTASEAFKDGPFLALLLESVGETRWQSLVEKFSIERPDFSDFFKTTQSYQEVFGYKSENVLSSEEKIDFAMNRTKELASKKLDVSSKKFDMEWFRFELSRLGILLRNEDVETLLIYHNLFGLNELELLETAKVISESTDDYLDMEKLRTQIKQQEESGRVKKIIAQNPQENIPQDKRRAQLIETGFTDKEVGLILEAETHAPMQFLRRVKEHRGTSRNNFEDLDVENAVKEANLPNSVINVLIYHVLVNEGRGNLNQGSRFNHLKNQWETKKLWSPEKAVEFIRQEKEEKEKKKLAPTKPRYSGYQKGRPQKVEMIPDYMENSQPTSNESSKEAKSAFEDMMKAMKALNNDDN